MAAKLISQLPAAAGGELALSAEFEGEPSAALASRKYTGTQLKTILGLTGTNSGDQTATTVANTPAGNIAATTVQAAITELDTEKEAVANKDVDGTLAANSDTKYPSQKAVKTYVDTAVTGLLDFKGATDASANPNYPVASKGDAYVVSVAGKVGGASGKSVDIGDVYLAIADNAGGTEASVGTSWIVLEHNLVGALLAANNLSELTSAPTALTNLGGTTVGKAMFVLTNPSAITFLRLNADNTVTALSASAMRTALGLGTYATENLGVQSVYIPAAAMTSRLTSGAAPGLVELATNKIMVSTLDFDATAIEYAQFSFNMPKSWDESTVTAVFVWSHAATTTNFGVRWGLQGMSYSDDDAQDAAFGTAQEVTDTGGTTDDCYRTSATSAITIGGTPAENDFVRFQVYRDPTNGADTMAIDARLQGVLLMYTINAGNDA